jgi:hypothetical protein
MAKSFISRCIQRFLEVVVESDGRMADHDNELGGDFSSTCGKTRGSSRLPLGVSTALNLST